MGAVKPYNRKKNKFTVAQAMLLLVCLLVLVLSLTNMSIASNSQSLGVIAGTATQQLPPPKQAMTNMTTTGASSSVGGSKSKMWSEAEIVAHMAAHPSRAYFSRFFRDGGFRTGIELGVADGRFSEHFLKDLKDLEDYRWTMIEPFPNNNLMSRTGSLTGVTDGGSWKQLGILEHVKTTFKVNKSLDPPLLTELPDDGYDFIYLDGNHEYHVVKEEIPKYWPKVKSGGVLAGHDYCNYGEPSLTCKGCSTTPQCTDYTEFGIATGKPKGRASNQIGVVKAVQEWLVAQNDSRLTVHHTLEDFTRESLQHDGMEYDLIITGTRNPSWFLVKP
jgi:hypothetical protein